MYNVPFLSARLPECHRKRGGNGWIKTMKKRNKRWEERERNGMLVSWITKLRQVSHHIVSLQGEDDSLLVQTNTVGLLNAAELSNIRIQWEAVHHLPAFAVVVLSHCKWFWLFVSVFMSLGVCIRQTEEWDIHIALLSHSKHFTVRISSTWMNRYHWRTDAVNTSRPISPYLTRPIGKLG